MDGLVFLLIFIGVVIAAGPGVDAYGLTWDEPTYFHFARLQRDWLGDVVAGVFSPSRLPDLFTQKTIDQVWLQHPDSNGHPPLNETWMGLAGRPFRWVGRSDTESFRHAVTLLMALTAGMIFALFRSFGYSRLAGLGASLVYLGIPAVWAHGHLGATETMQNLFWALLALLLPFALRGRRFWVVLWFLACGLAFLAKFTNILVPVWVLGTAAVMGGVRLRRFWVCAALAVMAGPVMMLLLDPFFWPWNHGLDRFADYIRQTTTRAQWVPIQVFYMGRGWGFHPPWHYRIVQTAVSLPLPVLALLVTGLAVSLRRIFPAIRDSWLGRGVDGRPWAGRAWPLALGLSGLAMTFAVGMLPATPNHDGTRQFVYVFFATALVSGIALDWLEGMLRKGLGKSTPGRPLWWPAAPLLALPAWALVVSLSYEPWGLSYYGGWIGGARGAWNRGFELTYWTETITPEMVARTASIPPRDGRIVRVHTIPKLNYFADAEEFVRPLLPPGAPGRRSGRSEQSPQGPDVQPPLGRDVMSAFFRPWAEQYRNTDLGPILGFSFHDPVDALIISFRRSTVAQGAWDFLDNLAAKGEIVLLEETRVDGVPLARLYQVRDLVPVQIPVDPEQRTWHQFPTVTRYMKQILERQPSP